MRSQQIRNVFLGWGGDLSRALFHGVHLYWMKGGWEKTTPEGCIPERWFWFELAWNWPYFQRIFGMPWDWDPKEVIDSRTWTGRPGGTIIRFVWEYHFELGFRIPNGKFEIRSSHY